MRISLPPSRGLRLDVKLVSLCHVPFPAALRDGLRKDVRLVSLSRMLPSPVTREASATLQLRYGQRHLTICCTTWGTFSYIRKTPAHWGVSYRIRKLMSLFLCLLVIRSHSDDPFQQMGPAECLYNSPYRNPAEILQDSVFTYVGIWSLQKPFSIQTISVLQNILGFDVYQSWRPSAGFSTPNIWRIYLKSILQKAFRLHLYQ